MEETPRLAIPNSPYPYGTVTPTWRHRRGPETALRLAVKGPSLPLHLAARESGETEQALARLVAGQPQLWARYGGWLASLHPATYEEVKAMARQTTRPFRLDLTPIVQTMGMDWVIQQLGAERVIEHLGAKEVVQHLGVNRLWAELSPEQRRQLKRLLQE